mgnify:CR=1 FL=1
MEFVKKIKLGSWIEWIINVLTLGTGKYISTWIAVDILGFESCGCCERKEWLNRLTNKDYNGHCKDVKLF